MKIAIIGAGNIGDNLARRLAKRGHTLFLARSGTSTRADDLAQEIGQTATSIADAVSQADLIAFAFYWHGREEVIAAAGGPDAFTGKIVLDILNPYNTDLSVIDLGGRRSSQLVADALPSAQVVKALNSVAYTHLQGAPSSAPLYKQLAVPVAGNDASAKQVVMELIETIGFNPIDAGGIGDSARQEPGGDLYAQEWTAGHMRKVMEGHARSVAAWQV